MNKFFAKNIQSG